jgi:hypothetical protein
MEDLISNGAYGLGLNQSGGSMTGILNQENQAFSAKENQF